MEYPIGLMDLKAAIRQDHELAMREGFNSVRRRAFKALVFLDEVPIDYEVVIVARPRTPKEGATT